MNRRIHMVMLLVISFFLHGCFELSDQEQALSQYLRTVGMHLQKSTIYNLEQIVFPKFPMKDSEVRYVYFEKHISDQEIFLLLQEDTLGSRLTAMSSFINGNYDGSSSFKTHLGTMISTSCEVFWKTSKMVDKYWIKQDPYDFYYVYLVMVSSGIVCIDANKLNMTSLITGNIEQESKEMIDDVVDHLKPYVTQFYTEDETLREFQKAIYAFAINYLYFNYGTNKQKFTSDRFVD